MEAKAEHIRRAQVYLTEARSRRESIVNRNFYWKLLQWAAGCRRRAAAVREEPAQGALF